MGGKLKEQLLQEESENEYIWAVIEFMKDDLNLDQTCLSESMWSRKEGMNWMLSDQNKLDI